jgi:hypothetical protein
VQDIGTFQWLEDNTRREEGRGRRELEPLPCTLPILLPIFQEKVESEAGN